MNVVVSFNSKDNANTFCRFFSNLADTLLQKLPRPKNKFGIKITEEYYEQIQNECDVNFVLCNVDVTIVGKILKNLDVAKPSGIYQFKDGTPVIVIHLVNIINVLIKLDTFSSKYKIAKVKPLFKKGIKTKAKNYRPISLLPLISKVIEKSIHDQTQDYLKRNALLYFYQSGFRANHSAGICLFNGHDFKWC